MGGLPGQVLATPGSARWEWLVKEWGANCNCGQPATVMIQGETDSYGYEGMPSCAACAEKHAAAPTDGTCDWCKKWVARTAPIRDIDEGSDGPVYYVCGTCRSKYNRSLEEELASY